MRAAEYPEGPGLGLGLAAEYPEGPGLGLVAEGEGSW